jgi:RNA polymerase sigma factor (sigma-70 family)
MDPSMTPRYVPECHEIDALRRLARRLTRGDSQSAEDLVQETLLVVLRMGRSNPPPHLGWLLGVARNVFRNQRRGDKRRASRESIAPIEPSGDDPVSVLERAELQRTLEAAVTRLPEHYRDVLVLRFRDGHSSDVIARQLAIAPASVRSRVLRALELLRDRLDRRAIALFPWNRREPITWFAWMKHAGIAACLVAASTLVVAESTHPTITATSSRFGSNTTVRMEHDLDAPHRDLVAVAPAPPGAATPSHPATIVTGRIVGGMLDRRFSGVLQLEARCERVTPPIEPIPATIADDGTFQFDLTPWSTTAPLIRGAFFRFDDPDHLPMLKNVEVIDAFGHMRRGTITLEFDLRLERAAIAAGRVFDERGELVEGARVVARQVDSDGVVRAPGASGNSAGDGVFRLRARTPGPWILTAALADGRRSSPVQVHLGEGENARVDLRLDAAASARRALQAPEQPVPPPALVATVVVRVHDRHGHPFERLCAIIELRDHARLYVAGRSLGDGRFEFEVPAGQQWIDVLPGASTPVDAIFLPTRFDIEPVSGERIVLDFVAREGGRIFARAVDAHGNGVACAAEVRDAAENVVIRRFHTLTPSDSYGDGRLSPSDGSRGERPLPPGTYTLVVRPGEPRERRMPLMIEPLVTTRAVITVDP